MSQRPIVADQAKVPAPPDRGLIVAWLMGVAVAFTLLISGEGLAPHVPFGMTFNEMLTQLLRWRFDVNPATIGLEAFVRNGRSYAYFGIFCALLRAPLLLGGEIRSVDITSPSIALATAIGLACRLSAANTVMRALPSPPNQMIRSAVFLALAMSGETLQFMRPSIYQEAISWSDTLASAFLLSALKLVFDAGAHRNRLFFLMALFGGLALLCRVTFGLGLLVALASVMVVYFGRNLGAKLNFRAATRGFVVPIFTVIMFISAVGVVNFERWGNPLTFLPLQYQTKMKILRSNRPPDPKLANIDPSRIPKSLEYYFVPTWGGNEARSMPILMSKVWRPFYLVELPPGSFFLSDPFVFFFAGLGLWSLCAHRQTTPDDGASLAIVLGLAIQVGLIISADYLTFRYRMEFYPAVNFAAAIGLHRLLRSRPKIQPKSLIYALIGLVAIVNVVTAELYKLSPWGAATDYDLSQGLLSLYAGELRGVMPIQRFDN